MDNNRLTTAQIKNYIMECVEDGEIHTVSELKQYITHKTDQFFSPGQISGAIMQLTALDKIQSRGRGLYAKGSNDARQETHGQIDRENLSEEQIRFREQIRECIETTTQELQKIVNRVGMWELTDEEFEFLGEIRKLNEQMKKIVAKC